ncbi:hypothetical protein A6R68_17917 [Neotoma lepida]|uniref:Claudin n=1 Tax=Neotoma lepida TaxID=56216 RepID=A0A1A6HDB2_NEOLE|nr:hypothetical protein A6R68_17917 [Neotoma lepida]
MKRQWQLKDESSLFQLQGGPVSKDSSTKLAEGSFSLAMLAWIGTIVCCGLPKWRVKKISERKVIWEGLWYLCEDDGLSSLSCMPYNSRPVLPLDLQVSEFWLSSASSSPHKLITSLSNININNEEKIMMAESVLFLVTGLLLLVPVSWVTHNVILSIANPQMVSQWKPEMGASPYLGWLSSLLLLLRGALLGGALLWCKDPTNSDKAQSS